MTKKVIQVPVDEGLLKDLDSLSRRKNKARAELIRDACASYLRKIEQEELDRVYQQGYQDIPEEPEMGEAQVAMSWEILSKESW